VSVRDGLVFLAGGLLGGAMGILAAYVTVTLHLVSPDNVAAGFGMGTGGVILGLLTVLACDMAFTPRKAKP
jgi:hypothetical protein